MQIKLMNSIFQCYQKVDQVVVLILEIFKYIFVKIYFLIQIVNLVILLVNTVGKHVITVKLKEQKYVMMEIMNLLMVALIVNILANQVVKIVLMEFAQNAQMIGILI